MTTFSASSATPFYIGSDSTYRSLAGYISNFRIVVGTALYTSSPFTPPAQPLTAVSGTSLLLSTASSATALSDSSGNGVVLATLGLPTWAPANPFYQLGASGSLSFLGTATSFLTVPTAAANLGTGAFTIEFWCYALPKANQRPFSIGAIALSPLLSLEFPNSAATVAATLVTPGGVNGVNTIGTFAATYNTWQHWAIVRNGNTITVYCQGSAVVVFTTTAGQSFSSSAGTPFYIGSDTTSTTGGIGRAVQGFLSNFRIVVGTAVYTAPFAPPASPLTAIAGTSLLLSANSAAPLADSSANAVTLASINVAWSPLGPFDSGACSAPALITCTQVGEEGGVGSERATPTPPLQCVCRRQV